MPIAAAIAVLNQHGIRWMDLGENSDTRLWVMETVTTTRRPRLTGNEEEVYEYLPGRWSVSRWIPCPSTTKRLSAWLGY